MTDYQRHSSAEEREEKVASPVPTDWKPDRQIYLIIAGTSLVVFVAALDTTILTLALPVSTSPICVPIRAVMTDGLW